MSTDEPASAGGLIKVLLVDDQRMIGEVVRRLLDDETDIAFHYCADAAEALTRANEIRPDVILQDLIMPKISGLELVAQYRANPPAATASIIVLSGSDDAATRAQAEAAGANGFLVKLPSKADLVAHIRSQAGRTT